MQAYLQQNIRILFIAITYCFIIPFLSISTVIAQEDTVIVGTGWNMVGSLYNGLAIDIIRTEPADIIVSQFFGYNPGVGYEAKDTLKKGVGYWVNSWWSKRATICAKYLYLYLSCDSPVCVSISCLHS